MSKKYYVERKADNVWMVAAEDGSDAQEFNDQGRAIRCCIELNTTVIGAIAHPSYMPLHREIGDADNGKTKLKVCVGATASTPLIKHPDGRIWSLGWAEIIELAVKAFDEQGGQS